MEETLHRIPKFSAAILIGLVLFAIIFSIVFMLPQSIGLDEAQSLWQSAHSFPGGILYVVAQDVHVPLYHFILHFWQVAFGNGVPAARILSLLFYLPTIIVVYFLGRIAFKESIGLFGAALFALSPFTNWYGSVIRMYGLLVLVTAINQLFFLLILKGRPAQRSSYWAGYFISGFFGIFTHYFFLFNLGVQAIFFLVYRKSFPAGAFKKFLIISIVLFLLFVPWLLYVRSTGGLGNNTSPKLLPPNSVDVFNTFSNFLFGFQTNAVNAVILSSWPLITLFLFLAIQRNKKIPPEAVFFFAITIIPIVAAAILSYAITPFYLSRYFLGIFPAFCLLVSWLFSLYPRFSASLAKTALAFVMLFSLYIQASSLASPIKEDYRDVSNYVAARATARDIVAVSTPFTVYPVEYYYTGNAAITTLPVWNRLQSGAIPAYSSSTIAANAANFKDYERLWLILSYNQGYEENLRIYFDTHYERLQVQHFSPGLDLYVYRLRYDHATLTSTLAIARTVNAAPVSGVHQGL